jgi:hypothetical protein
MDSNTQKLLDGRLASKKGGTASTVQFANSLAMPISLYHLTTKGEQKPVKDVNKQDVVLFPGATSAQVNTLSNTWYFFRSTVSGAFVTLLQGEDSTNPPLLPSGTPINITQSYLQPPNDIGKIPAPLAERPVPGNSPNVVIGAGLLPNGNIVVREQYWALAPDSYMLEVGADRTVSTTNVTGMQRTSSTTEEFAASISASASASFWGVSASLSASLSYSSSSFQQVQVTEQTTQYEEYKLKGDTTHPPRMYLRWQLTDAVTVYSLPEPTEGMTDADLAATSAIKPRASLVTAQAPTIICGPFEPVQLPSTPPLVTSGYVG